MKIIDIEIIIVLLTLRFSIGSSLLSDSDSGVSYGVV